MINRVILGVVLTCFAGGAESQVPNNSEDSKLEFEVASVKVVPIQPGKVLMMDKRGGPGTSSPTLVTIENYPMLLLILEAYHLNWFQISGLTFAGDRFNVSAKVPAGATEEQYRLMLQKLLAQRFQLKVHSETKTMPIYEMTLAKNGPPLKQHVGDAVPTGAENPGGAPPVVRDKDGYPYPAPGEWGLSRSPDGTAMLYRFNLPNLELPEFAANLAGRLARSIVDATGLKGKYDFMLSCWVDMTPPPSPDGATPAPAGPEVIHNQIMIAIQKQLGLKLESKKGPVEILVVDHFDKVPAEN
jgi:uncharacterized protein (TIGR03435 family)